MPRPVYHYNREGALCLEKGITMPSSGIGLERKLMEETFSAWKKKNVNLLRRFLLRMVRNVCLQIYLIAISAVRPVFRSGRIKKDGLFVKRVVFFIFI